jgi:isopentenyl diphosphate isomerase/L-lactate dehydrogenase-like FMN-dependent dehydrogenase
VLLYILDLNLISSDLHTYTHVHTRTTFAGGQASVPLYIPALQLHVLALKQLRDSVPVELSVKRYKI